jgi:hypothetical protein
MLPFASNDFPCIDTEDTIDEAILKASRRGTARDALACETEALVYPDFPPESLALVTYTK